jgi:hypothetical protein
MNFELNFFLNNLLFLLVQTQQQQQKRQQTISGKLQVSINPSLIEIFYVYHICVNIQKNT